MKKKVHFNIGLQDNSSLMNQLDHMENNNSKSLKEQTEGNSTSLKDQLKIILKVWKIKLIEDNSRSLKEQNKENSRNVCTCHLSFDVMRN